MDVKKDNTSLEVLKDIISRKPEIDSLTLILHNVSINWRQKHSTSAQKMSHIEESLIQESPAEIKTITRQGFLALTPDDLSSNVKHQVWSFCSKVKTGDGRAMHLPMMNFHPLDNTSIDDIVNFIKIAFMGKNGVILNSGRYYHYYGDYLMTEKQWIEFNSKFLMPCDLVSPRYVGHRLQDGYSTLRLTADDKYKPVIPIVIRSINI
jgi:hypothetical protein